MNISTRKIELRSTQNEEVYEQNQSGWYIFISLLLCLFCVLKVIRGTEHDTSRVGGVWNYISILYYPLFYIAILKRKYFRFRLEFVAPFFYSFFALVFNIVQNGISLDFSNIYLLLMIPYFFLVYAVFYFYSDDSEVGNKIILVGYFVCLTLNAVSIIQYQFFRGKRPLASDIYFSLGLFPFALQMVKNKNLKIFLSATEFFIVFLSNKRTGLIACTIAIVIYIFVKDITGDNKNILKSLAKLIIIALCLYLFYAITKYIDDKYNLNIYYRLFRLKEDKGSGRGDIYLNIWNAYKESSILEKLTGHGLNSAGIVGKGEDKAHNDFLEILYNFGVIALICIIFFYVSLFVRLFKMIKNKSPYAASFAASLVIGMMLSLFSYFVIFYTYVTCVVAFWGYALSMDRQISEVED